MQISRRPLKQAANQQRTRHNKLLSSKPSLSTAPFPFPSFNSNLLLRRASSLSCPHLIYRFLSICFPVERHYVSVLTEPCTIIEMIFSLCRACRWLRFISCTTTLDVVIAFSEAEAPDRTTHATDSSRCPLGTQGLSCPGLSALLFSFIQKK